MDTKLEPIYIAENGSFFIKHSRDTFSIGAVCREDFSIGARKGRSANRRTQIYIQITRGHSEDRNTRPL